MEAVIIADYSIGSNLGTKRYLLQERFSYGGRHTGWKTVKTYRSKSRAIRKAEREQSYGFGFTYRVLDTRPN